MHNATRDDDRPLSWYLAYTEPRREVVALDHLDRQGYEVYLPLYGDREPMFPRYLFFRPASVSQSIAPVRSTRGVQQVVRFGSVYARVDPAVIAGIRIQEVHSRGSKPTRHPAPGQRVRVNSDAPAFAGLEGLVHSSATKRIVVLMEILGRQTPVKLPVEKLEIV